MKSSLQGRINFQNVTIRIRINCSDATADQGGLVGVILVALCRLDFSAFNSIDPDIP